MQLTILLPRIRPMIAILWALLGFILIGVQVAFSQIEFLFPGVAALLVALAVMVLPGFESSFLLQMITWVTLSFVSLVFLRKRFKKAFVGKEIGEERDEFSGQKAEVLEQIAPGRPGRVKFQGTSWTAISDTEILGAGLEVEILAKEGLTLTVTGQSVDVELKNRRSLHQKDWEQLEKDKGKEEVGE